MDKTHESERRCPACGKTLSPAEIERLERQESDPIISTCSDGPVVTCDACWYEQQQPGEDA